MSEDHEQSTSSQPSLQSQQHHRQWVWGSNGSGCLGIGHRDDLHWPTLIAIEHAPVQFIALSCGGCHTLGIDTAGRCWSWGENTHQQLGLSINDHCSASSRTPLASTAVVTTPQQIRSFHASSSPTQRCVSVAAGWTHSALIIAASTSTTQQQLFTWGDNRHHQCGNKDAIAAPVSAASSSSTSKAIASTIPFPSRVSTLRDADVVEIKCGWKHTLARARDGHVYAWGDNAHGDDITNHSSDSGQRLSFIQLFHSSGFLYALLFSFYAFTGQLGVKDFVARPTPTLITFPSAAAMTVALSVALSTALTSSSSVAAPLLASGIAVGWKHSLLLSHDRSTVYAMGSNAHGQCGIGAIDSSSAAAAVATLSGNNGSAPFSSPPKKISSATRVDILRVDAHEAVQEFTSIAAGWSHSLVLSSANQLYGFGRCDMGQLGPIGHQIDASGARQAKKFISTPSLIHLPTASALSSVSESTEASNHGGLSAGTIANSPSDSTTSDTIVQIACGSEHSMILTTNDLWVCGWNEHGNLGQGHDDTPATMDFTLIAEFHRDRPSCSDATPASALDSVTSSHHPSIRLIATGGAACIVVEDDP